MVQFQSRLASAVAVVREVPPPYGPCPPHPAESAADDSGATAVDLDVISSLGDEIAILAAHIHAATHRLLALLTRFDHLRGWEAEGHRSCAHWLSFRTGIDLGAAREKVRAARALVDLPRTSAAMARGELSFSKIRALTRIATADNEGDLLDLARGCTTAQLERIVRGWRRGRRQDEAARERERHDSRTFSVFPDEDGMYLVRGRLTPEVGALLMRAIEAAGDALYREEAGAERLAGAPSTGDALVAAARRRADALGLLAERALDAGFGGTPVADGEDGRRSDVPVSGTRAARYQVVLHVDAETLAEDRGPSPRPCGPDAGAGPASVSGRSELEDGTRVSAETSRRISCDAGLVRVTHGPDGSVLDVGRRTRTIPPALRRALEARDRGCRFPGCGLRFTDAHHVKHWADGGKTSLGNTVLLCQHHHRLVHEGGWRIVWWGEGRPVFIDSRGGEHYDGRWQPPTLLERPVPELVRANRRSGVAPDWRTAGARWKREADIPTDVYLRASEATG